MIVTEWRTLCLTIHLFFSCPLRPFFLSVFLNLSVSLSLFVGVSHYHLLSRGDCQPWCFVQVNKRPTLIAKSGQPCGLCWSTSWQTLHMHTLYSYTLKCRPMWWVTSGGNTVPSMWVNYTERRMGGNKKESRKINHYEEKEGQWHRDQSMRLNDWSKRSVTISSPLTFGKLWSTATHSTVYLVLSFFCPHYGCRCTVMQQA